MERKTNEHLIFSFMRLFLLSQHHAIVYYSCFYGSSLFKRAAIIIAKLGQKALQLSKVIPFGMYNCNFETIN